METLKDILEFLKEAQERWCGEDIDDGEEMWIEYPEFIDEAIPILEKIIMEKENQ